MNGKTDNAGWLCSPVGVFAQNSNLLAGGIRISSTTSAVSWIETPTLDLSQPVVLAFESKKWTKGGDGSMYCIINNDTILHVLNGNTTISPNKSIPFIGTTHSRIRFTGTYASGNDICIDSIRLSYSDDPTLSLPLIKTVNMGKVKPLEQLNYTLPISMINSSGMISFNVTGNDAFRIEGESTIEFDDEMQTNEIKFVFDAPEQAGVYSSKVNVDGGDNFEPRLIWLKAEVDPASSIRNQLKDQLKISIQQQQINITCNEDVQVKLYSITSQLVDASHSVYSSCELQAPYKGVFVLRVNHDSGVLEQKIIIN